MNALVGQHLPFCPGKGNLDRINNSCHLMGIFTDSYVEGIVYEI